MYINSSIKEYLDDLSAKKAAPGGGSAAALAGALGAALISMVCNFTLGKEKYKESELDIEKILQDAESIRKELSNFIDLDVEAYRKFSSSEKDESSLKEALTVPFEVCKLTHQALRLCHDLARKGNSLLISDVGCAAELLEGAFLSALFNVEVNLKGIKKEEDFIIEISKIVEPMKEEILAMKDTVIRAVEQRIC